MQSAGQVVGGCELGRAEQGSCANKEGNISQRKGRFIQFNELNGLIVNANGVSTDRNCCTRGTLDVLFHFLQSCKTSSSEATSLAHGMPRLSFYSN